MGGKQTNNELNQIIKNIENMKEMIESYITNTFKNSKFSNYQDIEDWKNNILSYLNDLFTLQINNIKHNMKHLLNEKEKDEDAIEVKDMGNKNKINISFNDCNMITSKDIQDEYSKIINKFKTFSIDFIDDTEPLNKPIGEFLVSVSNISRKSFNDSNLFLKLLYSDFESSKDINETIISSLDEFKLQFSSWVKNNDNLIKDKFDSFLNYVNIYSITEGKEEKTKNYLIELYKELLLFYFHCELSFPSIKVDFDHNSIFDSNKMEDYPHNKGKRKVNFIYFPSLFSNGYYLKNGKQWVFTYIDNPKKNSTFYVENVKLEPLIEEKKRFYIPKLKDRLKITLNNKKIIIPEINYKLSPKAKREFVFHLKNQKTNKIKQKKSDSFIEIENNEILIKLDFGLMSELILRYKLQK